MVHKFSLLLVCMLFLLNAQTEAIDDTYETTMVVKSMNLQSTTQVFDDKVLGEKSGSTERDPFDAEEDFEDDPLGDKRILQLPPKFPKCEKGYLFLVNRCRKLIKH